MLAPFFTKIIKIKCLINFTYRLKIHACIKLKILTRQNHTQKDLYIVISLIINFNLPKEKSLIKKMDSCGLCQIQNFQIPDQY